MIIGNDQIFIDRCLQSFKPAVDEIICVRSIGSADPDQTAEIAESHGAKILEYKNSIGAGFAHVDNFANARNMSFDAATGKYLLWCDCDDILPEGMAEKLRAFAEAGEYDWMFCMYNVTNNKQSVKRERLIRKGTGRWIKAAHENLLEVGVIKWAFKHDIWIDHRPDGYKKGSSDRNLNILKKQSEHQEIYHFYIHEEYFFKREKEKAIEAGKLALAFPKLSVVERYKILCNFGQIMDTPKDRINALMRALQVMPHRREALVALCCNYYDEKQYYDALAWARMLNAIPKPLAHYWTHEEDWYGWRATGLLAQCHRALGNESEANRVEDEMFERGERKISLIQPGRGRPDKAMDCKWRWLMRAKNPEAVQHIFAIDSDDKELLEVTNGHRRVVCDVPGSCNRAHNLAAKHSTGRVLFHIMDDLDCPMHWDELIWNKMKGHEHKECVLGVSDGHRSDKLMVAPLLNRKRYEKMGNTYEPRFKSMFSDNWFTYQAYRDKCVVEARDLVFHHSHPAFDGNVKMDKTYAETNAQDRYAEGEKLFNQLVAESEATQKLTRSNKKK